MPAFPISNRRRPALLGVCLALLAGSALAAKPGAPAADPLAPAMAGEYALQAGKLDEAARWYLEAARAMADRELRALHRVVQPEWWRLPERAALLQGLLKLAAETR